MGRQLCRKLAGRALVLCALLARAEAFSAAHAPRQAPALRASRRGGIAPVSNALGLQALRQRQDSGSLRYQSNDWLANVLSLPRSSVLRRVSFHLVSNLLTCALVIRCKRQLAWNISLPAMPHTLLGGFLGLLLVFRTNSAYARFWEGRMQWGSVMNSARNLAGLATIHVHPLSIPLCDRFLALLAAFPYALAHRCLAGSVPVPERVLSVLGAEPPGLSCASTVLLEMRATLARLAPLLDSSGFEGKSFAQMLFHQERTSDMSRHVGELSNALGACERLLRTPVPLTYSRHTSRFLTLWCFTLPLVLVDALGWRTFPVVGGICWALFGIEEIAHLIEQPFKRTKACDESVSTDSARRGIVLASQAKTIRLYDYGMPVEVLAASIADEVDAISMARERFYPITAEPVAEAPAEVALPPNGGAAELLGVGSEAEGVHRDDEEEEALRM